MKRGDIRNISSMFSEYNLAKIKRFVNNEN